MRAITDMNRLLSLFMLLLGIALGIVAAPTSSAADAGQVAAQAPACGAAAGDPPIRVWRNGRFAGS